MAIVAKKWSGDVVKHLVLGTLLTVAAGAFAQTPPAGALEDLGANASWGPTPDVTTPYSFTFMAGVSDTTVSFAFREVPAYWAFNNVSVSTGGGPNLITDPNFEGSTVYSNVPNNWGRWIQAIDTSAIGVVASPGQPYGCGDIIPAGGGLFWCDGSVQGYDAIYQNIATTIGDTYTISFDLADNSGGNFEQYGIDMLVYATDGLPAGTTTNCPTCGNAPPPNGVPEPTTIAILGAGLAGIWLSRRKNR